MIHIDFETRSQIDLKACGLYRYAEDISTDVLLACFKGDGEGPTMQWFRREPVPPRIVKAVESGEEFCAHNAAFEMALWAHVLADRHGWPECPPPERWVCTMAQAYAHGIPASLEMAAKTCGLPVQKDIEGYRLMLRMCKPLPLKKDDEPGTVRWLEDAESLKRLAQYCVIDVVVAEKLHHRLRKLPKSEREIWAVGQRINKRGVLIDSEAGDAIAGVCAKAIQDCGRELARITGGAVDGVSQAARLTTWLASRGYASGVTKSEVADLLEDEALPGDVREALEVRKLAARSSIAKIAKMEMVAGLDGRARGLHQYHGAATGREAGRLIQTQNLVRPEWKKWQVEVAINLFKDRDIEGLRVGFGEPLAVAPSCLRGLLRAAPGTALVACDFASVEARMLPWLANEIAVLNVFRAGEDVYVEAASGIYSVPKSEVSGTQRQIGKVSILALGYQGAVGAFQSMARNYGVKVDDDTALDIVKRWRKANRNIVKFWYALEEAAIEAINTPLKAFVVGKVAFKFMGGHLWMRLPSGRWLCYWGAHLDEKGKIKYYGKDRTGKHAWVNTYGGKLAENATQAACRDLLWRVILMAEAAGLPTVLHVHDEDVLEVPKAKAQEALAFLLAAMRTPPDWCPDLPLNAEGWIAERFGK